MRGCTSLLLVLLTVLGASALADPNDKIEPAELLPAVIAKGVPLLVAKKGFLEFDRFAPRVTNMGHMILIDMTRRSTENRLWLINRSTGQVDPLVTAHGVGSDPKNTGYAQYFSTVPNSRMTSLGAYLVQEKYVGKHGESLRLDGLERTNAYARERSIVLHAADYVKDGRLQGRSWGCPAVPQAWIKRIIERMAGGAFLYIHGIDQRPKRDDKLWISEWLRIPFDQWVNEAEDAPLEGE